MDQCKNCQLRGNMEKCIEADCTIHESWHVLELIKQLQKTAHNSDYEKCREEIMQYIDGAKVWVHDAIEDILKKHFA